MQKLCFSLGCENLSYSLRMHLFKALMHKSVGWYDDKNRTPGVLTNMLTEEISSVNGMTTESLGVAVEAIV